MYFNNFFASLFTKWQHDYKWINEFTIPEEVDNCYCRECEVIYLCFLLYHPHHKPTIVLVGKCSSIGQCSLNFPSRIVRLAIFSSLRCSALYSYTSAAHCPAVCRLSARATAFARSSSCEKRINTVSLLLYSNLEVAELKMPYWHRSVL